MIDIDIDIAVTCALVMDTGSIDMGSYLLMRVVKLFIWFPLLTILSVCRMKIKSNLGWYMKVLLMLLWRRSYSIPRPS